MRESVLLSQIASASEGGFKGRPDILVGPGDDCAVIRTDEGSTLLLTVDHFVEGVHHHADRPLGEVASACIARSVSDIAAMGGAPAWALATAALRDTCDQQRASDLFEAMSQAAKRWGCPLVGGDIAITPGPTILTVTVIGTPHTSRGPVLRSGAQAGDNVYVTGPLGAALASGWTRTPIPRLREAKALCDALGADLHAMIDISDGLGRDAGRIAERSGIAIELDAGLIPVAEGVVSWREAISAGEDYELCFTTPKQPPAPLGCVRVGRVVEGAGCTVRTPDGETLDAAQLGWDHHA